MNFIPPISARWFQWMIVKSKSNIKSLIRKTADLYDTRNDYSCIFDVFLHLPLLCQHHWHVWWWALWGGRWHYCVNITDVCGGGLCVAADETIVSTLLTCVVVDCVATDDTIVSTSLLYMNCNWHQFTLGFFVGFVSIFCFLSCVMCCFFLSSSCVLWTQCCQFVSMYCLVCFL